MTTRREFSGMVAAIMAATMVTRPAAAEGHVPLGLKLYTVRDDLAKGFIAR